MIFRFFILFSAISLTACFNPFFPDKGTPPPIVSSPARTIQLLREAYERRDIFAFENLIYSTAEFSSYTQISESYTSTLSNFMFEPRVFIDSIFPPNRFFPRGRSYYELKWEQEHRIHSRMFDRAEEIVFLRPLVAGETIFETDETGTDTISALVKTESSQIRIKYRGQDFTVDATGQIFAMKRRNGAWKIWKWIELN